MSARTLDFRGEEKVRVDVPARSRYSIVSLAPGIASSPEQMTPGDLRLLGQRFHGRGVCQTTYHRNLVGTSRFRLRSQSLDVLKKRGLTYIILCKELFRFTVLTCQAWNGHIQVLKDIWVERVDKLL